MAFSPLEGRVLGLQPCAGVGRVKRAPLICVACASRLAAGQSPSKNSTPQMISPGRRACSAINTEISYPARKRCPYRKLEPDIVMVEFAEDRLR